MNINKDIGFDCTRWNQLVIAAANSRENEQEHKNIYRVVNKQTGSVAFELKTDQEYKTESQKHLISYKKIPLREILNITHISSCSALKKEVIFYKPPTKTERYSHYNPNTHVSPYGSRSLGGGHCVTTYYQSNTTTVTVKPNEDIKTNELMKKALQILATRAQNKFDAGCKGAIKNVIAKIYNFFVTNSVILFSDFDYYNRDKISLQYSLDSNSKDYKLPRFIGNHVNFAHFISKNFS